MTPTEATDYAVAILLFGYGAVLIVAAAILLHSVIGRDE